MTKKRVRRSPDEARTLILDAADRVFAKKLPDAVGLKDVAREAGVSHALVTHYFGTYDGLVEATLERRFHQMMRHGALEEVRTMLPHWQPSALWARAIGAPELVAHLRGEIPLDEAVSRAIIASRQYAKSQRIFFRGRMRDWRQVRIDSAS